MASFALLPSIAIVFTLKSTPKSINEKYQMLILNYALFPQGLNYICYGGKTKYSNNMTQYIAQ